MKKTFLSTLLALVMCFTLAPAALGAGDAAYIGADGASVALTEGDYTEVTDSTGFGTSGTFYVPSDLTVDGGLSFTGDTTIVLGDGATLTVDGGITAAEDSGNYALNITTVHGAETAGALVVSGGITVKPTDENLRGSLNIWGGTVQVTGADVTVDDEDSHGIRVACGTMTVCNDAMVEATGGKCSGYYGSSYGIYVASNWGNNTPVISVSGSAKLTGTGGESSGRRGRSFGIYTYGGEKSETGDYSSTGFVISGNAEVTATGGTASHVSYGLWSIMNAGDNAALNVSGGTLTAEGGAVTGIYYYNASGAKEDAFYAGSYGIRVYSMGSTAVSITGGTVTATGGTAKSETSEEALSAGLYIYRGDGSNSWTGSVTVSGENAKLIATGGAAIAAEGYAESYGIYAQNSSDGTFTITDGATVEATGGAASTASNPSSSYNTRSTGFYVNFAGSLLTVSAGGTLTAAAGDAASDRVPFSDGIYLYNVNTVTITGTNSKVTATGGNATAYTEGTETSSRSSGIYVYWAPIVVVDDAAVEATGGEARASYGIATDCAGLTVESATVTATGGTGRTSYGIAANNTDATITINGGEVTAKGGTVTAKNSDATSCGMKADGAIAITSSTVKATGGAATATVTSESGSARAYSYGIYANATFAVRESGTVTVTGGEAKGASDESSFGLWIKGSTAEGETSLSVSGGTLTAKGGKVTNGTIGAGANGYGIQVYQGDISVTGGTVNAESGAAEQGENSAYANFKTYGIDAENSSISVTGGTLTATGGTVRSSGNAYSYGIRAKALTVSGSTTGVTATGGYCDAGSINTYGIYLTGTGTEIKDGATVTATGGGTNPSSGESCGIYQVSGTMAIKNGAAVTAKGKSGSGVYSYGVHGAVASLSSGLSLSVTDAALYADYEGSNGCAIYANTLTLEGVCTVKRSESEALGLIGVANLKLGTSGETGKAFDSADSDVKLSMGSVITNSVAVDSVDGIAREAMLALLPDGAAYAINGTIKSCSSTDVTAYTATGDDSLTVAAHESCSYAEYSAECACGRRCGHAAGMNAETGRCNTCSLIIAGAKTGSTYYLTLEEALAAVANSGTVTVLANRTGTTAETITINRPGIAFTIDFNSRIFNNVSFVVKNGDVTVKRLENSTQADDHIDNYVLFDVQGGSLTLGTGVKITLPKLGITGVKMTAPVTIDGATIKYADGMNPIPNAISVQGGTLTVKSGTIAGPINIQTSNPTAVVLSGGTFTGSGWNSTQGVTLAPGCAYHDTSGNELMAEEVQNIVFTGTFVVGPCDHKNNENNYIYDHDNDVCGYCGASCAGGHTYNIYDENNPASGACVVCGRSGCNHSIDPELGKCGECGTQFRVGGMMGGGATSCEIWTQNVSDMLAACAESGQNLRFVKFFGDVTEAAPLTVNKTLAFELNGHTLTVPDAVDAMGNTTPGIAVSSASTSSGRAGLTISGGTVNSSVSVAVNASGATAEEKNYLNLEGGVTVNGDVTYMRDAYGSTTGELLHGTTITGKLRIYISLLELLEGSTAFATRNAETGEYDILVDASKYGEFTNVQVISHGDSDDPHSFSSATGKCSCGRECVHSVDQTTGKCGTCGFQFTIRLIGDTDIWGRTFADVLKHMPAGDTVYELVLYQDLTHLSDSIDQSGARKNFSMDLNGHTLKLSENFALKLFRTAKFYGPGTIDGSLSVAGDSAEDSANVILAGVTLTGDLKLGDNFLLQLKNFTETNGTTHFTTVKGTITLPESTWPSALLDPMESTVLAAKDESGSYTKIIDLTKKVTLADVRVIAHPSHDFDSTTGKCPCGTECQHKTADNQDAVNSATGICSVCSMQMKLCVDNVVTGGSTVTWYNDFGAALSAVLQSSGVLRLYGDVTVYSSIVLDEDKELNLELNGHTLNVPEIEHSMWQTLRIGGPGTLNGKITMSGGTGALCIGVKTVNNASNRHPVTEGVTVTGLVTLNAANNSRSNSLNIGTVLAGGVKTYDSSSKVNGYLVANAAFAKKENASSEDYTVIVNGKTISDLENTAVKVVAHASHDFSANATACPCGFTCSHTGYNAATGICSATGCGYQFPVKLTVGENTYWDKTIAAAFTAAGDYTGSAAVTLYGDVTGEDYTYEPVKAKQDNHLTVDLGGFTYDGKLTVNCGDSATSVTVSGGTVKELSCTGGTLKLAVGVIVTDKIAETNVGAGEKPRGIQSVLPTNAAFATKNATTGEYELTKVVRDDTTPSNTQTEITGPVKIIAHTHAFDDKDDMVCDACGYLCTSTDGHILGSSGTCKTCGSVIYPIVLEDNDYTGYTSFAAAVAAVNSNTTRKDYTISVWADFTESGTGDIEMTWASDSDRKVKLDLHGHTLDLGSRTLKLKNTATANHSLTLDITNGTLKGALAIGDGEAKLQLESNAVLIAPNASTPAITVGSANVNKILTLESGAKITGGIDFTASLKSLESALGSNLQLTNTNGTEAADDDTVVESLGLKTLPHGTYVVGEHADHRYKNAQCVVCGKANELATVTQDARDEWYNSDKHTTDPETGVKTYLVESLADLRAFSAKVRNDGVTFEGAIVKLTGDIWLTDDGTETGSTFMWQPIGNKDGDKVFKGTFDGGGHTIHGLSIRNSAMDTSKTFRAKGYVGLFEYLENATVKNLNIEGSVIGDWLFTYSGTTTNYVGGLAGYAENTTITNVTFTGTVSDGGVGARALGGLVGCAKNCTISDDRTGGIAPAAAGDPAAATAPAATVSGTFSASKLPGVELFLGGVVGRLEGDNIENVTVENTTITASGNDYNGTAYTNKMAADIGGVVGYHKGGDLTNVTVTNTTITSSGYNTHGKDPTRPSVGGVVGFFVNQSGCKNITNVSVTGTTVTNTKGQNHHGDVGGLAGYIRGAAVENVEVAATVKGLVGTIPEGDTTENHVGGIVGGAKDATIGGALSTDANVTFTGTVEGNSGYTGGIVGWMVKESADAIFIRNARAEGNITAESAFTGGIVGQSANLTIENCSYNGELTSTNGMAGGIIAHLTASNNETNTIANCTVEGKVTATANYESQYVGGIAGMAWDTDITKCVVHLTEIRSSNGNAGGLVGWAKGTNISDSYNRADIYKTGTNPFSDMGSYEDNTFGGLVGEFSTGSKNVTIKSCYSTGYVLDSFYGTERGDVCLGALVGKVSHLYSSDKATLQNCYWKAQDGTPTTACGKVDDDTDLTVTSCEGKLTGDFAGGEVTWLLNAGRNAADTRVWFQNGQWPAFSGQTIHRVLFKNGEADFATCYVVSGSKVRESDMPAGTGITNFSQWQMADGAKFDHNVAVTEDLTVTAKTKTAHTGITMNAVPTFVAGNEPARPSVSGYSCGGTVIYEYSTSSGTTWTRWIKWSTLAVGSYKIRAIIPEDDNHTACTTDSVNFTVTAAAVSVTFGTGTKFYESIGDAVAALNTSDGADELKLLKNCTYSGKLTITKSCLNFDLNGYELAATGNLVLGTTDSEDPITIRFTGDVTKTGENDNRISDYGKTIVNHANVTLSNGVKANNIYMEHAGSAVTLLGNTEANPTQAAGTVNYIYASNGTLTVNGGKIDKLITYTSATGTVTITGGTVSNSTINGGTVTITGGTFGTTSIDGGTVTINDGNFAESRVYVYGSNGGTVTVNGGTFGYPFTIKNYLGGQNTATTTINGGTFNGYAGYGLEIDSYTATIKLSGGKFKGIQSHANKIDTYLSAGKAIAHYESATATTRSKWMNPEAVSMKNGESYYVVEASPITLTGVALTGTDLANVPYGTANAVTATVNGTWPEGSSFCWCVTTNASNPFEYDKRAPGSSASYTMPASLDVGTYYVSCWVSTESNYQNGHPERITAATTFTVVPAEITGFTAPTAKPDLTYDGSFQTLVTPGTIDASKGYFVYSLDDKDGYYGDNVVAQDAGTYTVWWKIKANSDNYKDSQPQSFTVTIGKGVPKHNAPQAGSDIHYNGSPQQLVSSGSLHTADQGTVLYALGDAGGACPDEAAFTETIPTGTNAGTYTVWWKIKANGANYKDSEPASIAVTILPATIVVQSKSAAGGWNMTPVHTVQYYPDGIPVSELNNAFRLGYVDSSNNFVSLEGKLSFTAWEGGAATAALNASESSQSRTLTFTRDASCTDANYPASGTLDALLTVQPIGLKLTPNTAVSDVEVTYDTHEHDLLNAGKVLVRTAPSEYSGATWRSDGEAVTSGYTLEYSLRNDGTGAAAAIPKAAKAGDYYIYARALPAEGNGNYTASDWTQVGTATINKKALEASMFTPIADLTFTGEPQTLATDCTTGTYNGTTLVCGGVEDYTIGYVEQTNAGSYTVTVTGIGNYMDWVELPWKIAKATTALSDVTTSQVYTVTSGSVDLSACGVPANAGTVTYTPGTLPAGVTAASVTGSTLSFTLAGTGTAGTVYTIPVTVSSDNYADTAIAVKVSLTAKTSRPLTVTMADWTYGGTPATPVFDLVSGALTPTYRYEGRSYVSSDIIYQDTCPTDAGTYTVTVTYETATEIYSGVSGSFTIHRRSISDAQITLGTALTYTGSEQTQYVAEVKANGETFNSGWYTVTGNTGTNAGSGYCLTVTVNEAICNNFTGTAAKDWAIAKATAGFIGDLVNTYDRSYDFSTKPLLYSAPEATGGTVMYSLEENGTYTADIPTATNAGTYTVWHYVKGDANHNDSAKRSATVTVSKVTIETGNSSADLPDLDFTGAAQTPDGIVVRIHTSDGWKQMTKDVDFTLTAAPQINAGTYSLTITGKGNFAGARTMDWTIDQANAPTLTAPSLEMIYTLTEGSMALADITGVPTDAGDVTFRVIDKYGVASASIADGKLNFVLASGGAVGDAPYVMLKFESKNYAERFVRVNITLTAKNTGTIGDLVVSGWTYGDAPVAPAFDQTDYVTAPTYLYTGTGYSSATPPTAAGDYTVTVTCETLTEVRTASGSFTIARRSIAGADITLGTALTFTGSEQTQTVDSAALGALPVDTFTVSGNTATNAGTYTLTLTGTGNFTGTATTDFTVAKAAACTGLVGVNANLTFTQTSGVIDLSGITGMPANAGTVTYAVGTLPAGVTAATVTGRTLSFTLDGSGTAGTVYTIPVVVSSTNYADSDAAVTVTLVAKTLRPLTVRMNGWTYGSAASAPAYGTLPTGATSLAITYKQGDTVLPGVPSDAGDYTVTVRYETATEIYSGTADFTIAKAAPAVTAPTANSLTFTGSAQALVTGGTSADGTLMYSLTEDGDYTAAVPTGINVDTYTVWYYVKGDGNHTDSAKAGVTVTIAPMNIADADITLGTALTFTGSEQTQAVTAVTLGSHAVTFTVSGNIGTNAGTYTLTVTGTGNFTGTATKDWAIAKAAAPTGLVGVNANLTFTQTSGVIDLSGITGMPANTGTLTYRTGTLPAGVTAATVGADGSTLSFTLDGTGTAGTVYTIPVVVSSTNYADSDAVVTVTLVAKTLRPLTVRMNGWTYGSAASTPAYGTLPTGATGLAITYKGRGATVYAESAAAPVNAGDYTVTVRYETTTEIYSGTADFTVAPRTLTAADLVCTGAPLTKIYDGTVSSTLTAVSVRSDALAQGDSLSVTGTAVYNSADVFAANKVTFTANAITGNYVLSAGTTIDIPAAITAKTAAPVITLDPASATYDGSAKTPGVTVKADGITLAQGTDYTVSWQNNTAAGTAKVLVTAASGRNFTWSPAAEKTFSIEKAAAVSLADILVSLKYTVTAEQSCAIGTLLPADAGTLRYTKGTASTTGSVTVTSWSVDAQTGLVRFALSGGAAGNTVTLPVVISSDNYADSVVRVCITLTDRDAQAALTFTGATTVTYGQTLTLAAAGGTGSGSVTFAVTDGTGKATVSGSVLTPVRAGTVTVTATKAGDANYAPVTSAPVVITIEKATPTGEPEYTAITASGKTLADAALSIGSITPAGGTLTWDDGDATIVLANTAYGWTYTPADPANYNAITGTFTPYVFIAGGGSSTFSITVNKTENGTVKVNPKRAEFGEEVTLTVLPDEGYRIKKITVLDRSENEVKLTACGSGEYTFLMPSGKVTVTVTFAKKIPFTDVPENAYYYDAVQWAADEGITDGIGGTLFAPDMVCDRAQAVTLLWRAAGMPAPKTTVMPFTDVPADAYYYNAVLWAAESGITKGTGSDQFSPYLACSRAQITTLLFRFAALNGMDAVTLQELVSGFGDAHEVPDFSFAAFNWALAKGVMQGAYGNLMPNKECTRAEIVTLLYRYMNNMNG